MTIRKGEPWGSAVARPGGAIVATTDAEIAAAGTDRPIVVAGGDLHRSLGSPTGRDPVQRVALDALSVRLDQGAPRWAIAHVVLRRSWWRGPIVAVMNVDHLGAWYVAPRAHPNDGRFDVVEVTASMSIRDRLSARSRLASGDHVPHPDITTGRDVRRTWSFTSPIGVWIDGERVGTASTVDVELVPDHTTVHF